MQALGLLIEAVADQQKAAHRKKTNTFVKGGLYRLSRHPNYLGEILFWVGSFIAAIGSLTGTLVHFIAGAWVPFLVTTTHWHTSWPVC